MESWHTAQQRSDVCRSAKEEALNKIEDKSRALQAVHEQVTADLRRADQQNKRELQINDQLLASMQVPACDNLQNMFSKSAVRLLSPSGTKPLVACRYAQT